MKAPSASSTAQGPVKASSPAREVPAVPFAAAASSAQRSATAPVDARHAASSSILRRSGATSSASLPRAARPDRGRAGRLSLRLADVDHPLDAEPVGKRSELPAPKRFLERHVNLAAPPPRRLKTRSPSASSLVERQSATSSSPSGPGPGRPSDAMNFDAVRLELGVHDFVFVARVELAIPSAIPRND